MSGKRPRTIDEAEDDRCFGPLPQEDILREDLRALTAERDSLKAELERKSERLANAERIICNNHMPKYVYASPDNDCFCSDTAPCEEDGDKCERYGLYDPDSLGFYDMVELLREFLKNYPDDVFPRHADGKRDVGVIFVDMLKDVVDFLDEHPEGQAERQ